jgi:hypothetical protein
MMTYNALRLPNATKLQMEWDILSIESFTGSRSLIVYPMDDSLGSRALENLLNSLYVYQGLYQYKNLFIDMWSSSSRMNLLRQLSAV